MVRQRAQQRQARQSRSQAASRATSAAGSLTYDGGTNRPMPVQRCSSKSGAKAARISADRRVVDRDRRGTARATPPTPEALPHCEARSA